MQLVCCGGVIVVLAILLAHARIRRGETLKAFLWGSTPILGLVALVAVPPILDCFVFPGSREGCEWTGMVVQLAVALGVVLELIYMAVFFIVLGRWQDKAAEAGGNLTVTGPSSRGDVTE